MAKTLSERVSQHRTKRKSKTLSLDGDTVDRLAAYQKANNLPSRSAAINSLLEKCGH